MPYELPPNEFFPPHHRQGLFYSEAWQAAWLKAYGNHPNIQIHPEAGIYTYRQWLKRILPVRSATLIGATSPATRSIRAEYTCLTEEALSASLNAKWDQLVLPDILAGSEDERRVHQFAKDNHLVIRETEREPVYAVDLRQGTFEDYLARLGRNTRLRLYNRRKRLEQKGKVTIENLWPDRNRFYDILNDFHQQRWGRPCYAGRNKIFIDRLLDSLCTAGYLIDLSVLYLSETPVSAVLDIQTAGRHYNLQSGFDQFVGNDLSLGTIHLGHQIEKAFSEHSEFYDLLAGEGKKRQYKASISSITLDFVSVSLLRGSFMKQIYKARHVVTGRERG